MAFKLQMAPLSRSLHVYTLLFEGGKTCNNHEKTMGERYEKSPGVAQAGTINTNPTLYIVDTLFTLVT